MTPKITISMTITNIALSKVKKIKRESGRTLCRIPLWIYIVRYRYPSIIHTLIRIKTVGILKTYLLVNIRIIYIIKRFSFKNTAPIRAWVG